MAIPDEGQLVGLQLPDGSEVRGRKINGRWIKDGDPKNGPGLQISAWRSLKAAAVEKPTAPAEVVAVARKPRARRK